VRAHAKITFLPSSFPLQPWLWLDNLIRFGNDTNGTSILKTPFLIVVGASERRFVSREVVDWEEVISKLSEDAL
jgi:hypothetical protein